MTPLLSTTGRQLRIPLDGLSLPNAPPYSESPPTLDGARALCRTPNDLQGRGVCQSVARTFSTSAFKPTQGTTSDSSATFTKLIVLPIGRRPVATT
jgi:hypothetical protein